MPFKDILSTGMTPAEWLARLQLYLDTFDETTAERIAVTT